MGRTQKSQNVVEVGNIQLGFLSEKRDNFNNELVYFAITDKDWKTKMRFLQAIAEGNKALKVPYFIGDQGHPILRVKKKFIGTVDIDEFQPIAYTADLVFELYCFTNKEGVELTGYYCKVPCIQAASS